MKSNLEALGPNCLKVLIFYTCFSCVMACFFLYTWMDLTFCFLIGWLDFGFYEDRQLKLQGQSKVYA